MKIFKYIAAAAVLLTTLASCEKNTIEFPMEQVNEQAQIQLHYMVPLATATANNIFKVELNDQVLVQPSNAAVISTFNGIPGGQTGLYYAVEPGKVRIRLYQGANHTPVYDKVANVPAGKYNVFVHDFNSDPVVISTGYGPNGFTFPTNTVAGTDSATYVRFYNFMYEEAGKPYVGKLQYQYQRTNLDKSKTEWANLGKPVAFGECTDWTKLTCNPVPAASYGDTRFDFRILTENGEELMVTNTSNKEVKYTDYWTERPGRRYQHIFRGIRTSKAPNAGVSQWTAL